MVSNRVLPIVIENLPIWSPAAPNRVDCAGATVIVPVGRGKNALAADMVADRNGPKFLTGPQVMNALKADTLATKVEGFGRTGIPLADAKH